MTLKVAIIGASFAKEAMLPAFAHIQDAEVVAIASARLESAQAAANAFSVGKAYDNWQMMLDKHPIDLVCIATPTIFHAPMTLAALDAGAHIICEKPMAMNVEEAQQMYEKAESLGRIHIIDHELRFNPNRKKIKQLIEDGYIGRIQHANIANISATWGDPASRPKNDWWSRDDMGGGRLGANGSHQLDLVRFWMGDVGAVCGQVATMVPNRVDRVTSEPWTATADDQVSWIAETTSGAIVSVFLSGVARHGSGNQTVIYGSEGTIKLDNSDEKLLVARAGEEFVDMSEHDPNANLPGIGKGIWNVSFVALAQEVCGAIQHKRRTQWGATFEDGLKTQVAMDAIRRSWQEKRWITLD